MKKIEIIAIGNNKIYSVGYIKIYKRGDIYHIHKIVGSDIHTSIHEDGTCHWKFRTIDFYHKLGKRVTIKDFKGLEFLGVNAFGIKSLPQIFSEYKIKKCNGIFAIDMREYNDDTFNLALFIVTKEGLSALYDSYIDQKKRQLYLFTDNEPMIALIAFEFTR